MAADVMSPERLQTLIESAFERRAEISPSNVDPGLSQALGAIVEGLNSGRLRVAEKRGNEWVTNQWVKKAVLLYFRANDNRAMPNRTHVWFDKVQIGRAHV